MKRIAAFLVIIAMAVGSVFAEQSTLIDFTKLTADANGQNTATLMDFSTQAGASWTEAQKAQMKTSLFYDNWDVSFVSSSNRLENFSVSIVKGATSQEYGTVMGTRIHFPTENWASVADVKPPFEIPAYEPGADGSVAQGHSQFENGYGILKNVGSIKQIAVNVYGLRFPHALYALLIDQNGIEREYFMGYLNFDGWKELVWTNPNYVQEVRNRQIVTQPLYPTDTPFIKFAGFRVKRDASNAGGDFIGYFKNVDVIYDQAVLDTSRDIDDESIWNIIETRENEKKDFEFSQFGERQILQQLERDKQATETFTAPQTTTPADTTAAPAAPTSTTTPAETTTPEAAAPTTEQPAAPATTDTTQEAAPTDTTPAQPQQ
jgi:hypothetical protein